MHVQMSFAYNIVNTRWKNKNRATVWQIDSVTVPLSKLRSSYFGYNSSEICDGKFVFLYGGQ